MTAAPAVLATWALADPRALFGLALAVPLVGLHLYLKRRQRVRVASLRLLAESLASVRHAARFRRVRDRLALLARLAALLALLAALGGLAPVEAVAAARPVLLLLDAERTTSAEEADGRTRFEHIRAAARARVAALPRTAAGLDAPAALWRAGAQLRVLAPFTSDLARLEAALRDLTGPPDGAIVDLAPLVHAAADELAARGGGLLVVVTARALPGDVDVPGVVVERHGVGLTRADQGVSDLEVLPRADAEGYDVRVHLVNHDREAVRRTLRLRVGSLTAHEVEVALEAEGTAVVDVPVPAPAVPSVLVAEWLGRDAWGANDELRAVLDAAYRPSVLLVHEGGVRPYTQAVVDALGPEVDVARSGIVSVSDLVRVLEDPTIPARDVVIVDGATLPAGAVRDGAWVFLGPLRGDLPFEVGEPLIEPLVWRVETGHPLVRDLDLGAAFALSGQPIRGEGVRPLAHAEGLPVLAEGVRGAVRYVALGLDPERSALPLQAALPLLVRHAVRRLAVATTQPFPPLVEAGRALRPRAPLSRAGAWDLAWTGFGRDAVLEPAGHGTARGPLQASGPTTAVAPGAAGVLSIAAPGEEAPRWRVGILPADPGRSIAPAGQVTPLPPAAAEGVPAAGRWRRRFLALGALLLLLDLLLGRPALRLAGVRGGRYNLSWNTAS